MGIAYRSSASNSASTAASCAISVPAGVVDGDMLVMFVAQNAGTGDAGLSIPSGWAVEQSALEAEDAGLLTVLKRVASSEPASYTLNVSGSNTSFAVCMVACSDTDSNPAIDTSSIQENASSPSCTGASISPANSGDTLLYAAASFSSSGVSYTGTPPSGMTELVDITGGLTNKSSLQVSYQDGIASGATGNFVSTLSGSTVNIGALVAVKSNGAASSGGANALFDAANF